MRDIFWSFACHDDTSALNEPIRYCGEVFVKCRDEEGIRPSHHNCKGAHKRITQEQADAFLVSDYAYAVVRPSQSKVQLW